MNNKKAAPRSKAKKDGLPKIPDPVRIMIGTSAIGSQKDVGWAMERISSIVETSPVFLSKSKEEQDKLKIVLGSAVLNWSAIFKLTEMLSKGRIAFFYFKKRYAYAELQYYGAIFDKLINVMGLKKTEEDKGDTGSK